MSSIGPKMAEKMLFCGTRVHTGPTLTALLGRFRDSVRGVSYTVGTVWSVANRMWTKKTGPARVPEALEPEN